MGSVEEPKTYDVVVIGGGFSGIRTMHGLTAHKFNCHMFEAGTTLGGAWYWNTYPGARVDTNVPLYQFTNNETWDQWDWTQKYPGWAELQAYFQHIDNVWGISKNATFSTRVQSLHWNKSTKMWDIQARNELDKTTVTNASARYVVICSGHSNEPYNPPIKGIEKFKGFSSHTSRWPKAGVDLKDKRVGIIGTGATGVQFIQEAAKVVKHLTVMQRTYINAFPIDQVAYDKDANNDMKLTIAEQHETSRHTWAGFPYTWYPKFTFDDTEEQRQAFWEDLWKKGGFQFWIGNYQDVAMNQKANDEAYAFWRKKVHARVNDKTTAEKLAPLTPIYPMCTKRPCLENKFYEVFNQDNVDLVNLRENGIQEFTEDGVIFEDGSKAEFDILVKATGFDSITGGITSIDIRGTDANISIKEKWSKGVRTYLGQTSAGFPNLFWIYGPQAPTAFVNGPTGAEAQSDWMVHTFAFMRRQGYSTIEATPEAEAAWRKEVVDYGAASLFAKSGGWYYGANIPGKPQESLNYLEGMPKFKKRCWDAIANNYEGFELGK